MQTSFYKSPLVHREGTSYIFEFFPKPSKEYFSKRNMPLKTRTPTPICKIWMNSACLKTWNNKRTTQHLHFLIRNKAKLRPRSLLCRNHDSCVRVSRGKINLDTLPCMVLGCGVSKLLLVVDSRLPEWISTKSSGQKGFLLVCAGFLWICLAF